MKVSSLVLLVKVSIDEDGSGSAVVTNPDGEVLSTIDQAAFGDLTLEDILIDVVEGAGFDLESDEGLDDVLDAMDLELPQPEATAEPAARLISVGTPFDSDDDMEEG